MAAVDRVSARYSLAARLLHWLVAILVVAMITTGVAMTRVSLSIETTYVLYQWHKSLGLMVGVTMLARLVVRWRAPPPPLPVEIPIVPARLAKAVHALLYVCLVALPVLGWLATSAASLQLPMLLFGLFEVPSLTLLATLTEPRRAVWYGWLASMHAWLALLVAGLLAVHIGGVVRHGRIVRQRMSLWP